MTLHLCSDLHARFWRAEVKAVFPACKHLRLMEKLMYKVIIKYIVISARLCRIIFNNLDFHYVSEGPSQNKNE